MFLSEISIKRPITTIMMSVSLLIFGILALTRLPIRELPDIDPPVVNILTVYPGASAEVVETELTEPLEEAINSIEGIKEITSSSREQASNIAVEFDLTRDVELAAQDVRDRVARIRGALPEDIDEPVVSKQDASARPIMWVALFSERYTTLELTKLAEDIIKDRLQTVAGVSSVIIGGEKQYAMRLWLDPARMAAHGITVLDVQTALQEQNVELPSGRVENLERELTIQTRAELKTAEEYDRLVIRREGDTLVRLEDIGRAEAGVEDERAIARYNSQPSIGLGIVRQSKANIIAVARGVKAEIEALRPLLPEGVNTFYAYDESTYVERAVLEVWETLGIAFVLVVLSIFLFLRNVRSTIIPTLAIPVSILGTFILLHLFGYSVNIVTLLALVLAIGIVVDDSIVVLENIFRHIEEGKRPMEAARIAMGEISYAIVAITLSLVAVFLPLAFLPSLAGRLFIEFAVALCGAVLISAFIALTLAPMVASRVLRPIRRERHGRLFNFFERRFDGIARRYERVLGWSLRHRLAVVMVGLFSGLLTLFFFSRLDSEFLPEEDKGRLFAITLTPEGSTSEYTDRMVRKMEEILAQTPEVEGYFTAVALPFSGPGSPTTAYVFARLAEDRDLHVRDLVNGPTGLGAKFFTQVEGAFAIPVIPKAIDVSFGQPFQLVLQHPDLTELDRFATQFSNQLRAAGFLANVRPNFEWNKPELRVEIDRDRAASLGVSIQDLARTLQILFGGLDLSSLKLEGREYDVIGQLERSERLRPADLERIYVRSASGGLVQLSNLVRTETGAGPNVINRYNRIRSATIEGTPQGVTLGTAVERVETLLAESLPAGFRYEWESEAENLKETGREIYFVVLLAMIIVYMVLAAQFESLIHPITVMIALPLAVFGAFGALWFLSGINQLGTMFYGWANYAPDPPAIARWGAAIFPRISGMNLNLFSQVGLVLLIGLVTKNSILLVEFANQQRAQGKSAREAMLQAGLIRLRPILMTSLATIAGILPIAIGFGASAEGRRPLGVVAVGGLVTSTLLTLIVIPVIYTLFSDLGTRFKRTRPVHEDPSALAAPEPCPPLPSHR